VRPRDNAPTSRSHIARRKFWRAIFAPYWQHEAEGTPDLRSEPGSIFLRSPCLSSKTLRRVSIITHAPKMQDFREDNERMHQQGNNASTRPSHRARCASPQQSPFQNLRLVTNRSKLR